MLVKLPSLALAATAVDAAQGADGDGRRGAGPPATTAAAGPAHAPAPRRPVTVADLGALLTGRRRAPATCPSSCPPDHIRYCDGAPQGGATCGGDCCTGTQACDDFTGCVKKDGSCHGFNVCKGAHIPTVEGSCHENKACYKANIPSVEGSCQGQLACSGVAVEDGAVGVLKDSCNGRDACMYLANNGTVGDVTSSCNGAYACTKLGYHGEVKKIAHSCNENVACTHLAYSKGSEDDDDDGYDDDGYGYDDDDDDDDDGDSGGPSSVGPIQWSCNSLFACEYLASKGGSVKSVKRSCNSKKADKPCSYFAIGVAVGHVTKWRHSDILHKYSKNRIDDVAACVARCAKDAGCRGIQWKEHAARSCWTLGGDLSEEKCGPKNVCITM